MKLIVALIDFSEVTSDLVTLVGQLARATCARLILLHVAMPDADFVNGREQEDRTRRGTAADLRRRRRDLDILKMELRKLSVQTRTMMVRGESVRGNPLAKIVEELKRLNPDLIVMGTHGRGRLHQLLVGSVTNAVVRRIRRPTLLVPSPMNQVPSSRNQVTASTNSPS